MPSHEACAYETCTNARYIACRDSGERRRCRRGSIAAVATARPAVCHDIRYFCARVLAILAQPTPGRGGSLGDIFLGSGFSPGVFISWRSTARKPSAHGPSLRHLPSQLRFTVTGSHALQVRCRFAQLFVTTYRYLLSEFSGADGVKVRRRAGNSIIGWSTLEHLGRVVLEERGQIARVISM